MSIGQIETFDGAIKPEKYLEEYQNTLQDINRTSYAQQWHFIDPTKCPAKFRDRAHRLNALGDNFYFGKIILKKDRLSNSFHRIYCDQFLCWQLQDVFEIPRDHFKTTIGAVIMPMWWALPFTAKDEWLMRTLGYTDEWISWMKRVHDQNTRTLIAMEVIKNAWKIGKKIAYEYENNTFFKRLFPEIQPDSRNQWNADTLTHRRDYTRSDANQGEGTYEFTGVDAALQSKHYKRIVCDDLFGRAALDSELVADSTWDWVKLLVGAMDSEKGNPDSFTDLVFNGNRWSFHDLNDRIRKNLPGFRFHTHDAEGSCCPAHPAGQPIFPEEWSMAKLHRMRVWLGEYFYSCQFRNKPIPPGGNVFKAEWLRYFAFVPTHVSMKPNIKTPDKKFFDNFYSKQQEKGLEHQTYQVLLKDDITYRQHMSIRHEVFAGGNVMKDVLTSNLHKLLLVDPNHAGEKGRANNAILELGYSIDPLNLYMLEIFARTCSREDAVYQMYRMGERWKNRIIWVETSAGQTWLKTLLELENENRKDLGKWYFYEVKDFRDNRSENAKSDRIEDTEIYFRRGQIWICSNDGNGDTEKFKEEYNEYPHGKTRDTLDILGHAIQNLDLNAVTNKESDMYTFELQNTQMRMRSNRNSITGY